MTYSNLTQPYFYKVSYVLEQPTFLIDLHLLQSSLKQSFLESVLNICT